MGKGCVILIFVLIGLGVGIYWLDASGDELMVTLGLRERARAVATAEPPPPDVGGPQPELEVQVAEASTAVAEQRPYQVIITEEEANARINSNAAPERIDTPLGRAEVRDSRIRFLQGEAVIESNAVTGAASVPLRALFDLSVSPEGRVQVEVRRVEAGGVPLPSAVRGQVQQSAQQQLDQALGDLPNTLERIDVYPGRVVVSGSG